MVDLRYGAPRVRYSRTLSWTRVCTWVRVHLRRCPNCRFFTSLFSAPRFLLHHLCFYSNTTSNITRTHRYMKLVHKTRVGKGAGIRGSGHQSVTNIRISFFAMRDRAHVLIRFVFPPVFHDALSPSKPSPLEPSEQLSSSPFCLYRLSQLLSSGSTPVLLIIECRCAETVGIRRPRQCPRHPRVS
ncbi:hypothetical protein K435DRAFT_464744 [Dendrothele bispora CBS 962.96]|uniref:Uncharacterized protein n=1 Tax=Dendrothele bispora (strain CBS 962.96) TaxID=1314807 RepID=A0A4S8L176_DENBC|nr:hypothetical protein K435DRAFT_464744 [Dendrothele bispora CBS 962.96]